MKTKSNQSPILDTSSITLASLMGLTLLSGLVLSSSLASADTDATDVVTITVPTSCSMSSTGTNSHTAEIGNGQSNSTIGETTITTYCNDNEGFAIYAIGYTGDTLGNNKLTSTSLGSTHDIVTGTATSGNTSNWAMKLSTISSPAPNFPIIISGTTSDTLKEQGDPDYSTFQEVPDDYTKVAYRTSSTDVGTNAEGSILKTTYQAYISPTQSAGTYQGKVKYVLVNPHNGDAPTKQTGVTCNPSGTTIGTGNSTDLVCMQDFASLSSASRASVLTSMATDAQYQLYDSRDNKQYYIAKLQDGNVWMTQNLDHDIKNDGTVTYDNTTTDLGWNTATNSYDTASWTPMSATHVSDDNSWGLDLDSFATPNSYDPGNLYWNGELNTGREDSSNYISSSGNSHYHLGNYYSWTVAVAMDDSSAYIEDGTLVEQSICPAGWTLPRAGTGEDTFEALWGNYDFNDSGFIDTNNNGEWDNGENALWTSPLYFALSSRYYGTLDDIGWRGDYWSPIVNDDQHSYGAYFNPSNSMVLPSTEMERLDGCAVRCIARPVSSTVTFD